MKKIKPLLLLFFGLFFHPGFAQINIGGQPYSHLYHLRTEIPVEIMPEIDLIALQAEDEEDAANNLPYRFGKSFEVNYHLNNSGVWTTLPNGDRVWQLIISAPAAKSMYLTYSEFWLPKGAVLYLYNQDRSQVIGGFTDANNKGSRQKPKGFATSFIQGDLTVLEYYEPAQARGRGIIKINQVIHAYRQLTNSRDFGDSGDCQVNINCPEGDDWQEEKRAVAILVSGVRVCTGSLINNTCGNLDPLFLIADHCFDFSGHDAIDDPNGDDLMFLWDYESEECPNPDDEPDFFTTTGAVLLSNDTRAASSDFALLRLDEDPADLEDFVPYYVGWDITGDLEEGGVGIHHPAVDIKKIATHDMVPTGECGVAHGAVIRWLEVFWQATPNGFSVTEAGSSGSPLFNNQHRILGQLWGGNNCSGQPNCDDPADDEGLYGALTWSWDNNGAADNRRRLRDWLDACNTEVEILDGISGCAQDHNIVDDFNWAVEFEADNNITANNTIGQGSNNGLGVRYDAGNSVRLTPGFNAVAGAQFQAYIDGCEGANPRRDASSIVYYDGTHREDVLYDTKGIHSKVYPNPFHQQTTIEYTILQAGTVSIEVFDLANRLIFSKQIQDHDQPGTYTYELDASGFSNGVYYYKLRHLNTVDIQRIIHTH